MAEIKKEKAKNLLNIFLPKYNTDFEAAFIFDHLDDDGDEYDIFCIDKIKDNNQLKIQVVESVPTRNLNSQDNFIFERNELTALKKFEDGKINEIAAIHLQTDELRIIEALGHKYNKYPRNSKKDLVILIDFGLFSWDEKSMDEMKKVAQKFDDFKAVYCIHLGNIKKCERLV